MSRENREGWKSRECRESQSWENRRVAVSWESWESRELGELARESVLESWAAWEGWDEEKGGPRTHGGKGGTA